MKRRSVILASLLAVWATVDTSGVLATEAIIVRSGEATPYKAAARALRDALDRKGVASRDVTVRELARIGRAEDSTKRVYLAIGTRAANHLKSSVPAEARLGYCLVARPYDAQVAERDTSFGVGTEVRTADQIRLLSSALKKFRRVGCLFDSNAPISRARVEELRQGASAPDRARKLEVLAVDIRKHRSFSAALKALLDESPDVILTWPDRTVFNRGAIRAVLLESVRRKTPVFGFSESFCKAGALLATTIDPSEQGRQLAELYWTLRATDLRDVESSRKHVAPTHKVVFNEVAAERLSVEVSHRFKERVDVKIQGEGR